MESIERPRIDKNKKFDWSAKACITRMTTTMSAYLKKSSTVVDLQTADSNQTLNFFMKRTSPILAIPVIILLYIRPVLRPNESHKNPKITLLAKNATPELRL